MADIFYGAEIARINLEDERNGAAFYEALSRCARTEAVRKFALETAESERGHERVYREMLEDMRVPEDTELYEGERREYLAALVRGKVFPDIEAAEKMALEAETDLEAVEIALRMEKNTLQLLTELRKHTRKKDLRLVDQIIEEEEDHVKGLTRLREEITGG